LILDGEGWVRHHERPPTGILADLRQGSWARVVENNDERQSNQSSHYRLRERKNEEMPNGLEAGERLNGRIIFAWPIALCARA
jgi:hypothetical protein